jgi:hypothetical protein
MSAFLTNQIKPDKPLYHYTSQVGLLGIIHNRQIWATNILFLNDSQEAKHAMQLVQENINRFGEERKLNREEIQFLENFSEKLRIFHTPYYQKYGGVYTCSFSEKRDQLSQWRGYCPDGSGFSIGFDFNSSLSFVVEKQSFTLVKCEYNKNKQIEMIDDFLNKVLDHFYKSQMDASLDLEAWDDFFALAPILKHPKFEEEQEWRLISKPRPTEFSVDFRPGKSMLIPYIKINLTETQYDSDNDKQLKRMNCIPEICLGPTLYPSLSRIALESLLLKEDVHREVDTNGKVKEFRSDVVESDIPYRVYSS